MGKRHFLVPWGVLALATAGAVAKPPPALPPLPVAAIGQGDPLIADQWHHAALGTPEAWQVTRGERSTVLAFVDSGIDYTHPDLAPNLSWNAAEWPMDGQDTDGNGFADDVVGYDFEREHYLPFDGAGHGTFLSGLAAAVEGNGIGIAGVCPGCTVLPLKFIDADGFGDTEDAIRAIDYAVERRVSVINVSFSGEGYDRDLHQALRRAQMADIVVVAAASNDGIDVDKAPIYPAKYSLPNLVTVAASTREDDLWEGSNWGRRTVHFAAPGDGVLSIWEEKGTEYDTGSGTSDAAAIVSGVAGLVRSANPGLTAEQAVQLLCQTVRPSAKLWGKVRHAGIVDAAAAVRCAADSALPCL